MSALYWHTRCLIHHAQQCNQLTCIRCVLCVLHAAVAGGIQIDRFGDERSVADNTTAAAVFANAARHFISRTCNHHTVTQLCTSGVPQ